MNQGHKNIGFVGLGEMGFPMALNLKKAGFAIFPYDLNPKVYTALAEHQIQGCTSITEMVKHSDAIIIMVRDLVQTEAVIFGENGIAKAQQHLAKTDLTLIVMSTLSPEAMHTLDQKVSQAGMKLIDAPVSGSLSGAEAASLTIMLGGAVETIQPVNAVFQTVGKNIFHFGEKCGAGQAAKLTNNLVLSINIMGVCEARKFGQKHGIAGQDVLKLLSVSTGNSWVVNHWESDVSHYTPEATLGIIKKDLKAVLYDAEQVQLELPFTALTQDFLFDSMKSALSM